MDVYFSGTYEHQMDAKHRIRVPARLKNELGNGYSIGIGTDGCLWIMPAETTKALQKRMEEIDMSDRVARAAKRKLLAGISFPEEDPQGRIVLPQNLISYAGIEKDLLFIGQGSYIELWAAERYAAYRDEIGYDDIDFGQYISFSS